MKLADFDFQLPDDLIARFPLPERSSSRLLTLNAAGTDHKRFSDILALIKPGDLMVFNDTRVIPARLFGEKQTGGKLEILIERVLDQHLILAHVRASKALKPGQTLTLEDGTTARMIERRDALFVIEVECEGPVTDLLEAIGHMPLPPYIDRANQLSDRERYQTVYARNPGAVAAPTAGLHFDEPLLEALKEKGVGFAYVTLHVGAGTFQPVRVENIEDHHMHSEAVTVTESTVSAILDTWRNGGRVIAVGTTAVRSLESAWTDGGLAPFVGETDIFITPGYRFRCIDALITNFHLPESTLLMLVSAFAGYEPVMAAYREAVENRYRFFSYGDAMFIEGAEPSLGSVRYSKPVGSAHES